jgi:hypothetical protein
MPSDENINASVELTMVHLVARDLFAFMVCTSETRP